MTTTRPAPTRRRLALLALLAPGALLLLRDARADSITSGYKGVSHEIRLEGLDRYPDLGFVLFPLYFGCKGAAYVASDQPLPEIKVSEPRLYAVRRTDAIDAEHVYQEWLEANAVAVSWHTFHQVHEIPDSSPEERIVTVFRVARIEGKKIVIEGVREETFDRAGRLLERRVPTTLEVDPDPSRAPEQEAPVVPPRLRAPSSRPGGGMFVAVPLLAGLGLVGAAWRRRGSAGALALVLGLGTAGAARANSLAEPAPVETTDPSSEKKADSSWETTTDLQPETRIHPPAETEAEASGMAVIPVAAAGSAPALVLITLARRRGAAA